MTHEAPIVSSLRFLLRLLRAYVSAYELGSEAHIRRHTGAR